MSESNGSARAVRLDLWLWAARFYRTRALAKQAIDTGKVEIGGQRAKASRGVHAGDALVIERNGECFEIEVLALGIVHGPASVAQTLYRESESSKLARVQARALRAAERSGYRAPETKPDTRARRLIRASFSAKATCFDVGSRSISDTGFSWACASIQALRDRRSC